MVPLSLLLVVLSHHRGADTTSEDVTSQHTNPQPRTYTVAAFHAEWMAPWM